MAVVGAKGKGEMVSCLSEEQSVDEQNLCSQPTDEPTTFSMTYRCIVTLSASSGGLFVAKTPDTIATLHSQQGV